MFPSRCGKSMASWHGRQVTSSSMRGATMGLVSREFTFAQGRQGRGQLPTEGNDRLSLNVYLTRD
ncbi:hypothetical protein SK128_025312 [Halocaridina rubra]|uniref:Uncharacterized protein n=1 Tax=Halocaridina rubra TaxID=373956 RepID=A0AAN9A3V8_HALRR